MIFSHLFLSAKQRRFIIEFEDGTCKLALSVIFIKENSYGIIGGANVFLKLLFQYLKLAIEKELELFLWVSLHIASFDTWPFQFSAVFLQCKLSLPFQPHKGQIQDSKHLAICRT